MTRLALRGKRGGLMAQSSSPVAHGIGRWFGHNARPFHGSSWDPGAETG